LAVDNLVVEIDTVLYFQVTDPRAAAYEIASFLQGVEQLTVTTLRNPPLEQFVERRRVEALGPAAAQCDRHLTDTSSRSASLCTSQSTGAGGMPLANLSDSSTFVPHDTPPRTVPIQWTVRCPATASSP
jgi:hypothetical protein